MPRFLQPIQPDTDEEVQAPEQAALDEEAPKPVRERNGSQSYWYALAEIKELQTRIAQIRKTKNPSFRHTSWRQWAEAEVKSAKHAMDGGDKNGDYWATYEMLKKVNAEWPGPP